MSIQQVRKIQNMNLLNLVLILYMLISFTKFFILKEHFHAWPSIIVLCISLTSIVLSASRHNTIAFLLFSLNVNGSVLFFNLYYPDGAGTYLFYFPLVVSVILLNGPQYRDLLGILYTSMFTVFFLIYFFVDSDSFRLNGLTDHQISSLWTYDLILSVFVTGLLTFLLVRLITRQNEKIHGQNERLQATQHALNISLKEKELLLAELHHRVKNNLSIMSSLLNMQISSTSNKEAQDLISESKDRIASMALVHRMLFETPGIKSVEVGKYTSMLVNELFHSYNLRDKVKIIEEYDDFAVPVNKSVPIGLMLNEIVTNSIKYVYSNGSGNARQFSISARSLDGNRAIIVANDCGQGFPPEFNSDPDTTSLGIFLIRTLAEQIDGEVRFLNNNGARVELTFTTD